MTEVAPAPTGRACRVCGGMCSERMRAPVLGRYEAIYDQCETCGYLAVRDPTWLDEAYDRAICRTDTGIVARNLMIADRLAPLLSMLGGDGPYLDYGGGLGLLTRTMRDRGYAVFWYDPFATNELAEGFEYDESRGPCTAVFAFEVIEHVEDPAGFVADALARGRSHTLVFSTVLFEGAPPPADWPYYAREEGQHIGFHTRASLQAIGARLGLRLHSRGMMHMLTSRPVGNLAFRAALGPAGRLLARSPVWRRRSLTEDDSRMLRSINSAQAA